MSTGQHSFDAELEAQRVIYDALKPFEAQDRDRLLRMVQERMARERAPDRLHRFEIVRAVRAHRYGEPDTCRAEIEHIELAPPPDAA